MSHSRYHCTTAHIKSSNHTSSLHRLTSISTHFPWISPTDNWTELCTLLYAVVFPFSWHCSLKLAPFYRRGTDLQKTRVRMRGADHIENSTSPIVAKACFPRRCLAVEVFVVAGMCLMIRCQAMDIHVTVSRLRCNKCDAYSGRSIPLFSEQEAPCPNTQMTLEWIQICSWIPTGPETKNNCAGEGQQQFTAMLYYAILLNLPCPGLGLAAISYIKNLHASKLMSKNLIRSAMDDGHEIFLQGPKNGHRSSRLLAMRICVVHPISTQRQMGECDLTADKYIKKNNIYLLHPDLFLTIFRRPGLSFVATQLPWETHLC
jgi:hypothetical protein